MNILALREQFNAGKKLIDYGRHGEAKANELRAIPIVTIEILNFFIK